MFIFKYGLSIEFRHLFLLKEYKILNKRDIIKFRFNLFEVER